MTSPETVLITGCSSGIGYELLRLMAAGPYRIVATALPSSLGALLADPIASSPRVSVKPLDVTDLGAASALVREIEAEIGPVDILVNNAGISYRSVVEDMTPEDEQRQMAVNYLGPMHLIRECLPNMRERRRGRIINISSVGGMMAMPTMASYSASKFALEGATESLWYELMPWGIHVSLVRPGFINSLAFAKVLYSAKRRAGAGSAEYDAHYENMTRFVESIMTRAPYSPADVARRVYRVARRSRPPLRASGTPDASAFYVLRRVLPRGLYHKLLYAFLPKVRAWGPPRD